MPQCPRCGLEYSYVKEKRVGGRVYVYAVHYMGYEKVNGRVRKRIRECYLGPKEGYKYVSTMHSREGLVLKGLTDPDRIVDYLEVLASHIEELDVRGDRALMLATRLEGIARMLREKAKEARVSSPFQP